MSTLVEHHLLEKGKMESKGARKLPKKSILTFLNFFAYTKMHSRFWAICIAELISGSGWALEMDFGVFYLMIYFHLFCHFE